MTMPSVAKSLPVARKPTGVPVTITGTGLTGSGTGNKSDLGTTAVQVFDGAVEGKAYKVTVKCITASRKIAWATTQAAAVSPAIKADADGSVDEGNIIIADTIGGQKEEFFITDDQDVWLVASAAATAVQVTVVEVM